MKTREERLAALRTFAADSGRPVKDVLTHFGATLGLSAINRAALAHEAAQAAPKPAIQLHAKGIQREATKSARTAAVEQGVADVSAWRAYEQTARANPFAAARLRQQHGTSALERGRQLDTNDDEPPSAA